MTHHSYCDAITRQRIARAPHSTARRRECDGGGFPSLVAGAPRIIVQRASAKYAVEREEDEQAGE